MKILHFVDENRLSWSEPWIQLLSMLREKGIENILMCRSKGTLLQRACKMGLAVIPYDPVFSGAPFSTVGFRKKILETRPKIIHTRLSSAAAIGGFWGRFLSIPVISTLDKYPKAKYYRYADYVVACSSSVKKHILLQGIPEKKVITIHNSIDVSKYKRSEIVRNEVRKKENVTDGEKIFLAAGRFVRWKGFDVLIDAWEKLGAGKCRLWIVGEGPEKRNLISKINGESSLSGRVWFFPFSEDIRPFLWAADFFVQPSYFLPGSGGPEGFSLLLIEAMASGLPVAVARAGGSIDVIEEEKNGFFAVPGNVDSLKNALSKLINTKNYAEMTLNARKKAEEFDVSIIAEKYKKLYHRAISIQK